MVSVDFLGSGLNELIAVKNGRGHISQSAFTSAAADAHMQRGQEFDFPPSHVPRHALTELTPGLTSDSSNSF